MKAAILKDYDKNGCDLEIRDIPVPEISEKEVLVKIRTAGVNPLDNMIIHGEVKLIVPYSFPLVMGNEFVGFKMAGGKYDKMAAAKNQKYFFIFVHEDGAGLEKISEIFKDTHIEASVDVVFDLDDVSKALRKVASGGSKGKTILKIS